MTAVRTRDCGEAVRIELNADATTVLGVTTPLAEKVVFFAEAANVNLVAPRDSKLCTQPPQPFEPWSIRLCLALQLIENSIDESMPVTQLLVVVGVPRIREP